MANHDYSIANQSFPSFRTDLNNALAAIASTNSGTSAPSTTFANQLWYDSSANILYIRNEDNDANIPLLQLDQSADVSSTLATIIDILDASGTNTAGTDLTIRAGAGTGTGAGGKIILQTADGGSSGSSVNSHATAVTIADDGNVGIGTTTTTDGGVTITKSVTRAGSWDAKLALQSTGASDFPALLFTNSNTTQYGGIVGTTDTSGDDANNQTAQIQLLQTSSGGNLAFRTNGNIGTTSTSERLRIDHSGNAFLAKTAANSDNVGTELNANGHLVATRDGGAPFLINRKTDDGTTVIVRQDGTTDGQINVKSGDMAVGTGDTGIRFNDGLNAWQPFNVSTNAFINNTITLGSSGAKFNEIFCGNATINTSDETEKQDIASLTDKEIKAATAISKLFKTYKYKDAVASKGHNARTHTGVIAQQVRTALEAEGLDATKYSFWCSDTWWEHSVEVPAVEAVKAVTETQIDDDGNEVQVVVQEAVEAQDAYTRIDDYYTADEAPEGSTQKTLLGIRYPELLAFVGAATEQRLTSIEARLTALEG